MKRFPYKMLVVSSLMFLLGIGECIGWKSARAQVTFEEVETILKQAKDEKGELLSPKNLQSAEEDYKKAVELKEKGKSLKDINKRLERADMVARSVLNNIKLAEVTFSDVLPVRDRAIDAKAEDFVPDLWAAAERDFKKAVIDLEDGKVKQAKEMAPELVDEYGSVELEAIRKDITGSTRALAEEIRKDVSETAPKTYQRGLDRIKDADNLLNEDRYAREKAADIVKEADYELRHAKALAQRVKKAEESDMESTLLGFEADLARIADGLGYDIKFDGDIEDQVDKMAARAKDLQKQNRDLSSDLYSLREKMQESRQLKESLQTRLNKEKQEKERLANVQDLFNSSEVKVFRDENNHVVLRLVGLSFKPGSDTIEPTYFDLLSRVQKALLIYPGAHVVIEGHTDSSGDATINKALSQRRAEAIRQYLAANLNLDPSTIEAVGYGEGRPIANNETEEGRALNRRVDIVISPAD
jgi:outer membrane protein OmpA-like peptidoglycan-associated protein